MVRPLLKKSGLYPSQPKNDRPVSNLPFFSKLLERVVQTRLQAFLDSNNLILVTQSAYREFHSTETAVMAIYNDMLLAAEPSQVSIIKTVCSVPQRSVLCPRLFILYTADLAEEVQQYDVNFHTYADDNQLYLYCRSDDMTSSVDRLECCLTGVSYCMSANHLKLNAQKTELL